MADCRDDKIMGNVTDSKEQYQPQDWRSLKTSIRTRTPVWIGLAAIVGWLLSHVSPKKRRTYAHGSDHDANHHSEKITLASRQKQPKSGGGLLSLALELLGAVAIRLMQRYFKTWSTTLTVALKDPERRTSAGLAAVRNGAGMDARYPSVGADLHGDRLRVDAALPCGRGRARRRVCDRSARSNDFCRSGGNPVGLGAGSSSKECLLRLDHARFCLHYFC